MINRIQAVDPGSGMAMLFGELAVSCVGDLPAGHRLV
jgi:hypothetical protein